jgi:hypothetical protein
MRRLLLCALLLAVTVPVSGEKYSVMVKRLEKDLYRDLTSKTIIETKYCYEYTYGDEAILNWEGRYGDNWLLFVDSKTKCDVVALR